MDKNEIKKALYKEKPTAFKKRTVSHPIFRVITHTLFEAETSLGKHSFEVPMTDFWQSEMGDKMPAQLLIRWLV